MPPTRARCHPPVMVMAQCGHSTLQSLPLLFFSLPRRVNHHTSASFLASATQPWLHHTSASLHPPPTRGAPARRNAPKTSHPGSTAFLHPQSVVVIAQCSHSTLQSLHHAITTLQHLFLSYPTLASNNHNTKEPTSRQVGKLESWKSKNPTRYTLTSHRLRSPLEQNPKRLCSWPWISRCNAGAGWAKKKGALKNNLQGSLPGACTHPR